MPAFPKIRVDLHMSGANCTWKETHIDIVSADLGLAATAALLLASARGSLMGNGAQVDYAVVSNDGVFRDSLKSSYLGYTRPSTQPRSPCDRAYNDILLEFEGDLDGKYAKRMYLAGMPDALIIDPPGPAINDPFWNAAFEFYKATLKAGYGFNAQLRDNVANPKFPIVTTVIGANTTTVTTPALSDIRAVYLIFKGYKIDPPIGLDGIIPVIANPAANIAVVQRGTVPEPRISQSGYVRKLLAWVPAITNIITRGETHRKRGNRLGAPIGRGRKHILQF